MTDPVAPPSIWSCVRPLVYAGWVIGAVRYGLEFVAPDHADFIGLYYCMPIVIVVAGVTGRLDSLRFGRFMLAMLLIGGLVWGLSSTVAYGTGQVLGWQHGRFAPGSAAPPADTLGGQVLAVVIVAPATALFGSLWLSVWGLLLAFLPGSLRRKRAAAEASE